MLDGHLNREPVSRITCIAAAAALLAVSVPLAGFGTPDPTTGPPIASVPRAAAAPAIVPVLPSPAVAATAPVAAEPPAAGAPAAQVQRATIYGTLYDPSGGLLPGATLELVNADTRSSRTQTTDGLGAFEFQEVPRGTYDLDVTLGGFENTRRRVMVRNGDSLEQSFTMALGSIMETVTIVGSTDTVPSPSVQESLQILAARTEAARRRVNARRQAELSSSSQPSGVVRVGGNIRAPKQEFRVNPEYPFSLQGTGTAGQVVVRGKIDVDGSIKDLAVVEAAHPDFAQSAIDAVSEWIFEPTLLNGRPVETNITVNLYYTAR
jgi:TonB family protein